MNHGIFRRYLFKLTRPGFRAMHWDVGGRIILVKPRARVLDVINNAEVIVLILGDVRIPYLRGMSVDLSEGRLNNGLRGGCERVGWGVVSGWSGHGYRSERDIGRAAGECVDMGREGNRAVGQRRRRTIHIHHWYMLDERRRACACLYPGRL